MVSSHACFDKILLPGAETFAILQQEVSTTWQAAVMLMEACDGPRLQRRVTFESEIIDKTSSLIWKHKCKYRSCSHIRESCLQEDVVRVGTVCIVLTFS